MNFKLYYRLEPYGSEGVKNNKIDYFSKIFGVVYHNNINHLFANDKGEHHFSFAIHNKINVLNFEKYSIHKSLAYMIVTDEKVKAILDLNGINPLHQF